MFVAAPAFAESTQVSVEYIEKINNLLRPVGGGDKVVDLFAGCGGLSLGFEARGFEVTGFEMEPRYCETHNHNLLGKCHESFLTEETELPAARVVIGGPPCQPFSVI